MEWLNDGHCRGYSEILDLYVCWEDGELRWFDPKTETYLRTFTEEIARADRAEAEREREAGNRRFRERLQELGEVD